MFFSTFTNLLIIHLFICKQTENNQFYSKINRQKPIKKNLKLSFGKSQGVMFYERLTILYNLRVKNAIT